VKSQAFSQSAQLLAEAAQLDPNVRFDLDIDTAFRDALGGVAPAKWIVPEEGQPEQAARAAIQQQAPQAAQAWRRALTWRPRWARRYRAQAMRRSRAGG
jgi:hypothetical protein